MEKKPHAIVSAIPLVFLILMLSTTIAIYGSDTVSGGSQLCLLTSAALCVAIGMIFYRVSWDRFEEAITDNIKNSTSAIIILLLIGSLSAIWMISGVVPTLIYYGLEVMHPSLFLVSTCIITVLVSVMTGSSWATIATIGLALMAIGRAQGYSDGWVAGAIISGAYFGDKISPLSDTTVLASTIAEVPIMRHIRYMLITTIPAIVITMVIFTVAGLTYDTMDYSHILGIKAALKERFDISPLLLIVPTITMIMIIKRMKTIITLFVSCVLGGIAALVFQADILREIAVHTSGGTLELTEGLMTTYFTSTQIACQSETLAPLIATRGMESMLPTIWLIICAMCFGGAMTASGMLESLISLFTRASRNAVSLVSSTVASGLTLNTVTADQYVSIILTGSLFKPIYQKRGYENRLLSRTTEDAVTATSPLIPWNSCAMTHSTVLSVPTMTYLPYCFFNILSPVMSIVIAIIGFKIMKPLTTKEKEEKPTVS